MDWTIIGSQNSSYREPAVGAWIRFLPWSGSRGGLRQVQSWILRDLDRLLHGGQQTLSSLSSQGGTKTLRASDQQLHHHVGVLLHTLTCNTSTSYTIRKRNGQSQLQLSYLGGAFSHKSAQVLFKFYLSFISLLYININTVAPQQPTLF